MNYVKYFNNISLTQFHYLSSPPLHTGFQLCLNETAGCSHYCNGVGSNFSCSCPPGFTLAEDGRRCGKSTLVVAVSHLCTTNGQIV